MNKSNIDKIKSVKMLYECRQYHYLIFCHGILKAATMYTKNSITNKSQLKEVLNEFVIGTKIVQSPWDVD